MELAKYCPKCGALNKVKANYTHDINTGEMVIKSYDITCPNANFLNDLFWLDWENRHTNDVYEPFNFVVG